MNKDKTVCQKGQKNTVDEHGPERKTEKKVVRMMTDGTFLICPVKHAVAHFPSA